MTHCTNPTRITLGEHYAPRKARGWTVDARHTGTPLVTCRALWGSWRLRGRPGTWRNERPWGSQRAEAARIRANGRPWVAPHPRKARGCFTGARHTRFGDTGGLTKVPAGEDLEDNKEAEAVKSTANWRPSAPGRVGTISSNFLSIWDRFDSQVFLGVGLYIKTEIIFFKFSKLNFYPPYQGSEKLDPPIIWQKMNIILEDCLIA